ncbi:cysteine-tryptophan domain-containing zinc finger protein 3-like isoform X2 [Cicer arietinum]
MPPTARIGNTSHSSNSFHDLRAASVDISVKKDSRVSSNDVTGRCTLKDVTAIKTGNSTDQRTLKFRLKMNSNILQQKTAEIYSGLGLDDSPSSSMDNSPVESEGTPPVSKEKDEGSPSGIIQVMTSFLIPGGVIISPLHESLLNSVKREKVVGDNRYISSRNGHQEPCSMSTDESDSFAAEGHLKKRIVRIVKREKQVEMKHMNGTLSESDMALQTKKKLGNRTPDCKDFLSNDLKCTPLSSSICDAGETAEVTAKASNVTKKFSENGVQSRTVPVKALKEESLESISGQDFKKVEKPNAGNSFRKNVVEVKLENSQKDSSTDPKNENKCNTYTISINVECDAVKSKIDKKYETPQRVKAVSEGKNKSKRDQSPEKPEAVARKDSSGGTNNNAVVTDKGSAGIGSGSRSNKMIKTKSLKDTKVRDSSKGSLKEKNSDWKVDGFPGNSAIKTSSIINNEKPITFGAKVKERPSGNKVVNHLQARPCKTDALGSFPTAEYNPAPETIPTAAAAPQLIAENWVACDSCQQWRLLPTGVKTEQLPEKWLCSMLDWLPGMNSCHFTEDQTTKALYALYGIPFPVDQNNLQTDASDTAFGVGSADGSQFGLHHRKSSSDALLERRKKKHVFKEKMMSGVNNDILPLSNSGKISAQASGKNRSLNDVNQHPTDSKSMKMMSSKHSGRFNSMVEEKHMSEEKEKQISGGNKKHIKLKRKMDADDQLSSGTLKKSKTEHVPYAGKQLDPGTGLRKVVINARNNLPTKAIRKDTSKYDEYCLPEDSEDSLLVPVKKDVDQAQVSSGSRSLDVKSRSKSGVLINKRKLKDWPNDETEKQNISYSLHGDKQCGEEGNARKLRKENQSKVLDKEAELVTEGDDKLRKGVMRQVGGIPGSQDQMTVETEARYVDNDLQPMKRRKNVASHHAFDGIDLSRKDLGRGGQLAFAATSSSSKVSGSHKARTNFDDVKGSPVESVTSSPLRSSNLDKRILAARDVSVKDDAMKVRLSSTGSRKGADNREGTVSVKLKEDRVSYNAHHASNKLSSTDYPVKEAKDKARVQAKTYEIKSNHLIAVPVEEHGNCAKGMHREEKVNKNNQDELSGRKSDKVPSLHNMEKNRRSGSQVGTDKMKVSASENFSSKNGGMYDSEADPSYHASGPETRNDAKYHSPMSKCEIDNVSQKNALRHGSIETGKQTELRPKDFEKSVTKMDTQRCTGTRKTISQQNATQDVDEESKANHVYTESRDRKSKVISSADGEIKRETSTVPRYHKGDFANEHPVQDGNSGLTKLTRDSADSSGNVLVNCSSGSLAPGQQLTVSSPARTNASQTAVDTLDEATKLKERADHYKNSGFDFESNETYFQAGLKFLHGASLLESCHNEITKHSEMSQMQIYATAAKLFKSCAHEYESRQEMAAAALAYKCMEVAYMRVVYCKHSSTNRDRYELQSTLQVVSQGESPSSSASDVDNLNNQVAMDKATLPKVTSAHVAGNQVISVRTRPSLLRLLDFTQDINLAMEATTKCQSTFTAANAMMDETRNRDCITSIRRVIDFSFQDVDELVRLVRNATKALSGAGLGGGGRD